MCDMSLLQVTGMNSSVSNPDNLQWRTDNYKGNGFKMIEYTIAAG